MSPRSGSSGRPGVTAVIVSHDGERWLPRLLAALSASTMSPDRVICVDTGSSDTSAELLAEAFGPVAVLHAPSATGFGAAVALGLAAADNTLSPDARDAPAPRHRGGDPAPGWLWLLHDDCAPAPDTLERLLATATADPAIAVVGCRLRSWPRGRRLLELGVTITGTGRRETGLEPGEYDQGQHADVRSVLAVSSAGMLVRRRVWDQLGGFDPQLPLFRDDVDFGWRAAAAGWRVVVAPDAVLFHSEASTRGVRAIANTSASPHLADRRAALFVLLANTSRVALPWQYLRLIGGSALRAMGFLVGKLPDAAYDEAAAAGSVLLRPGRVLAARSKRRKVTPAVGSRQLRALFLPWWTPYANGLDALLTRFGRPLRAGESSTPMSARLARSPLVGIVAVLVVAALVAGRHLLGGGLLHGGGLLPAPGGARDWWRLYGETRHDVGLGSDLVTAPYVAALALTATVLLGKAWLAVDVILLLAVPLSALGAYVAARRLVTSAPVRVWMAVTYGLVPVLTGAVTTGHIGTVVACIALPWLVLTAVPLLDQHRRPTWQAACSCGLVLTVAAAFAPLTELMGVALLLVGSLVLVARGQAKTVAYAVVAVALPLFLLAPWSLRILADPRAVLSEAGLADPMTSAVGGTAWQLPFGRLDAAGAAPWWLGAGVLVAAACSVLRRDRRTGIAAAWLVVAVALVVAAVLAHETVALPGSGRHAFVWLGLPVAVAQGAAIVAAGLAADGLFPRMRPGWFGLRRWPIAVVGVVAIAAPIAGAAWWVWVAPRGELSRHLETPLPAYMSDALLSDPGRRALVIRQTGNGVTYQLIVGAGLRLGDDSVLPRQESSALTSLVGSLLSEPGPGDVSRLAARGIRYIVLPTPTAQGYVAVLDRLPRLTRASTDVTQLVGWQVPTAHTRRVGRQALAQASAASAEQQPVWLARHRPQWLAGEALVWLVTLILAAPSLNRSDDTWEDER
jgi:GT2 family glycosyltransferase